MLRQFIQMVHNKIPCCNQESSDLAFYRRINKDFWENFFL